VRTWLVSMSVFIHGIGPFSYFVKPCPVVAALPIDCFASQFGFCMSASLFAL